MRLYVREHTIGDKSTLLDKLHLRLLHAIAITELMLEKPTWVEPPSIDRFDLSTLTHQILSSLAETGGCQASRMYDNLCIQGAFRTISTEMFARVLRCLAEKQLVEQMEQRDLILAPKGEQMVRHYSFYGAFATGVDYNVLHGSVPIGTLPSQALPKLFDHFLLGGRRWQVSEIDTDRREIMVKRSRGKKPPVFLGGNRDVHPRIRAKMRDVLLSDRIIGYLDDTAKGILSDARKTASVSSLGQSNFVAISTARCYWFTWTGSRIQRTLMLLASSMGLRAKDQEIAIEFEDLSPTEVAAKFLAIEEGNIDSMVLVRQLPSKQFRKLDELLSEDLLTESLAADYVDIPGAIECLNRRSLSPRGDLL
jgi:ATP-dependent helicase Lhr and Lhr-like helicase